MLVELTAYNFIFFLNASMTTKMCFRFDLIDGSGPKWSICNVSSGIGFFFMLYMLRSLGFTGAACKMHRIQFWMNPSTVFDMFGNQ